MAIKIRGRNGYVQLASTNTVQFADGTIFVEFWSKRTGDAAPVVIHGPAEDVAALFLELSAAVALAQEEAK